MSNTATIVEAKIREIRRQVEVRQQRQEVLLMGSSHMVRIHRELLGAAGFRITSIARGGATVATLRAMVNMRAMRGYHFIVVCVGSCDLLSKQGVRTSYPNKTLAAVVELRQQIVDLASPWAQVLFCGLIPKGLPAPNDDVTFRYGLDRPKINKFNSMHGIPPEQEVEKSIWRSFRAGPGHPPDGNAPLPGGVQFLGSGASLTESVPPNCCPPLVQDGRTPKILTPKILTQYHFNILFKFNDT